MPVQAGKTAVMLAIEKGHEGFLKLLIAARADLNQKDNVREIVCIIGVGKSGLCSSCCESAVSDPEKAIAI